MRLTAFTDYSLRVLIYLAAEPQRRATVGEIAQRFDIKQNHLTKVVHALARHGWITTVRGKGGGLMLAIPPEDIVLGAVVRQTEGPARPAECFEPGNQACSIARMCRLRGVLHRASEAFYAVLDEATLADLVHNGRALRQVLQLMPVRASRGGAHA